MSNKSDGGELKTFISVTLQAIVDGVSEVQESTSSNSAHDKTGEGRFVEQGIGEFVPPYNIEFDIAITAKNTGTKGGGLKLEVFSVGVNAGADSINENASTSRIKFTVERKVRRKDSY